MWEVGPAPDEMLEPGRFGLARDVWTDHAIQTGILSVRRLRTPETLMSERVPAPGATRKTVVFWILLLAVVQAAWYLAEPTKSRSPWTWWPLVAFSILFAALLLVSRWLSRTPMAPEVEALLARIVEDRARCKSCGYPRMPDDLFCDNCHPRAGRAIVGLVAVALAGTVAAFWWLAWK